MWLPPRQFKMPTPPRRPRARIPASGGDLLPRVLCTTRATPSSVRTDRRARDLSYFATLVEDRVPPAARCHTRRDEFASCFPLGHRPWEDANDASCLLAPFRLIARRAAVLQGMCRWSYPRRTGDGVFDPQRLNTQRCPVLTVHWF